MNPIFTDQEFKPRAVSRLCSCEPTTLLTAASIGIAAGGAGISIAGQSKANSAARQVEQQKANAVDKQIAENRRRATQDYIASITDIRTQEAQDAEALAEQEIDLGRTARDATSQARVAAGESGVAGQSLAIIEQDYLFQQEQAAGRLGISKAWRDAQREREIQAHGRQFTNRVSQVQPYAQQPVMPVNWSQLFAIPQTAIDVGTRTGLFRSNPLASE